MFAKVYCYWCEDETHNTLVKYMWDESHVRYQTIDLAMKEGITFDTI